MKHGFGHALAATAFGMAGLASGPAVAATAAGPYYATPSWDQQLPASTRFVTLSNWVDTQFPLGGAAVLDRETGLVWERSSAPILWSYEQAQQICAQSSTGGRAGWRVPSLHELSSLLDPAVPGPGLWLPAGHPFIGLSDADLYWTATSREGFPTAAWAIALGTVTAAPSNRCCSVGPGVAKSTPLRLLCVRGGGPVSTN